MSGLTSLLDQIGPDFRFNIRLCVLVKISEIGKVTNISLVAFAELSPNKDNLFTARKCPSYATVVVLGEWTRPTFCPEAGPALSWPGHSVDKKRKGQRAIRTSVYGSGQQCEAGLKGREGEQA